MTWRLSCPEHFAEQVRQAGGVNRYDEPIFRLIWAQSPEAMIRAGGIWENPDLPGVLHYRGYRNVLVEGFTPCWLLQQWFAPEARDIAGNWLFGTPGAYYVENYDMGSGLQTLGEYPYSGRYMTVFPLLTTEGEAVPLSPFIVNLLIPIILLAREITVDQKKAVLAEQRERKRQAEITLIEDSLKNARPAFGEIRSAAGLGCVSVVQRKMEAIEQYWQTGIEMIRRQGKGLSVAN